MWPNGARTGPWRSLHGLFTDCLRPLNPYGARKLLMHALKLYGPPTGRQNSYGAPQAGTGSVSGRTFCLKQPMNSPCRTGSVIGRLSHIQPRAPFNFSTVRFLSRKAERSALRDFTLSWSHQANWHSCTLMVWSNNRQDSPWTPCRCRTGPVRNPQCFSYPTGSARGPCGTRKGAVRHPYGHVREL